VICVIGCSIRIFKKISKLILLAVAKKSKNQAEAVSQGLYKMKSEFLRQTLPSLDESAEKALFYKKLLSYTRRTAMRFHQICQLKLS
jgi:flagellar motor component MotA